MTESFKILISSNTEKLTEWFKYVKVLFGMISVVEVVLTYLAIALFAVSISRVGWLGKTSSKFYILVSLLAFILIMVSVFLPEPFIAAGFAVSIPAIKFFGLENQNMSRLIQSCQLANILTFIESLPNGFNSKIGADGVGLSQGQKQRLLIARAIYKDPAYIFFDEATNALDANNEKEIIQNLGSYFLGRTVIIIAHRLSTVMNADNIIVMDKGEIVEEGNHNELSKKRGRYFELVKNQLSLGA